MQSPTLAAAPLVTVNSVAVEVLIKAIVLEGYWLRHNDPLSLASALDSIPCKILRAGSMTL